MLINEQPFLPQIIKNKGNVFTDEENLMLNSALHIHMDNFLSFFTLRRMDEEFDEKFDSKISSVSPSNIMLHGLDDRVYKIENTEDIHLISPYHKAKKKKNLQDLLLLKGCIKIDNIRDRFKKILSQEDSTTTADKNLPHYKKVWDDFPKVLLTIKEMELECDEDSIASIHYRQFGQFHWDLDYETIMEAREDICNK